MAAFFILRPLRRWLLAGLLLPLVVWVLDRVADAWCEAQGDGILVRRVRGAARWLTRYESGPLAHRPAERTPRSRN